MVVPHRFANDSCAAGVMALMNVRSCSIAPSYPQVSLEAIPEGALPHDGSFSTIECVDMYEHRRQRLLELRNSGKFAGRGGISELAKATGVDASYISRLLYPEGKPHKKRLGDEVVDKLRLSLGLCPGWFDLPLGSRLDPLSWSQASEDVVLSANAIKKSDAPYYDLSEVAYVDERVPLISWAKVGNLDASVDLHSPGYADGFIDVIKKNNHSFALQVDGDSMTAPYGRSYPVGSIIIVDAGNKTPSSGQRVVAKLKTSGAVTFRQYIEESGRKWLKPLNPQYPPDFEPFEVIGVVTSTHLFE